jgi:hypothetical protein
MPPVSENQRKAMYAAKAGKSTLGIPKKVGAEFVKADKGGSLPEKIKPKEGRRNYAKGGPVKSSSEGGLIG